MSETWVKENCPRCSTPNWVCLGNLNDQTVPDIEGIRCWKCKTDYFLMNEEDLSDGLIEDGEFSPFSEKPPKPLTAKALGKLLHSSFEKDSWGILETCHLKAPPKATEAEPAHGGGLYEVLERVAGKLNKRFIQG